MLSSRGCGTNPERLVRRSPEGEGGSERPEAAAGGWMQTGEIRGQGLRPQEYVYRAGPVTLPEIDEET